MNRGAFFALLVALLGAAGNGSRASDKAPTSTELRDKRSILMSDGSEMRGLFDRWESEFGTKASMTSFRMRRTPVHPARRGR